MQNSELREISKKLALSIIEMCDNIDSKKGRGVLVNQIIRSATSVGANVHEAQYAQGTKDFISKLEIALKECNESTFWLELLYDTQSITKDEFQKYQKLCIELRRMMVSSITTLKKQGEE